MKESGENIHGYKLREMGETRQKSQQYFFQVSGYANLAVLAFFGLEPQPSQP